MHLHRKQKERGPTPLVGSIPESLHFTSGRFDSCHRLQAFVLLPGVNLLRIAARVAAEKTYPFNPRPKEPIGEFRLNDLKVTQRVQLEYIPISDINVPKTWSDEKTVIVKKALEDGQVLEPVRLTLPDDKGKWEITDGIHRVNAAIDAGYTIVPAVTTEYVPFGENPKPRTVDSV